MAASAFGVSPCGSINMSTRMLLPQATRMMQRRHYPLSDHTICSSGARSSYRGAFESPPLWNLQDANRARNRFLPSTVALSNSRSKTSWDGTSMSQAQFMERDTVLVTDENDVLIDSASKKSSHEFSPSQPRGILHRAFSIFLFDASTSELLLQKRACTKITFPNVWTNTCCSHPLHGMEKDEVDGPRDVKDGSVGGVRNAAVRKLEHELGIPIEELEKMEKEFKFLTRVHYWAADTVTHGEKSPWGEHEIDYILFATVPSKNEVTLNPHPEEVDDVSWVTQSKLLEMFDDKSLLFSPWFRLIAKRWMIGESQSTNDEGLGGKGSQTARDGWWDDLDKTMNTEVFCDYDTIHRFDPPDEHMGGAGNAGPFFGNPM